MANQRSEFGRRLRRLRKQRELTLAALAARAGISAANISKTENGLISPSYDVLEKLARGLGISFSALVADGDARVGDAQVDDVVAVRPHRLSVNRGAPDAAIASRQYDYRYLSTDLKVKQLVPLFMDPKARTAADFGELISHGGEEFVYVLSGTVDVITEHHAPVRLKKGDSLYLDSRMGHGFLAVGRAAVRLLTIASEPVPPQVQPASPRARARPRGR